MHEVTKLVAQALKMVRDYLEMNDIENEAILENAASTLQIALDKLCEESK